MSILHEMKARQSSNYIFEGSIIGKHISDNAMLTFLKRNFPNIKAVPHGFRSSFRDWAETKYKYSHRSMEYCLGHVVKNKTEAAYQRDDLLEKRYLIMQITKTSVHSGITRTLDLDVTFEEIAAWQAGELIQVAMPRLDADEREFIKTGITAEEWEEIFPPEEDE